MTVTHNYRITFFFLAFERYLRQWGVCHWLCAGSEMWTKVGEEERGWPANCVSVDGQTGGWIERGRERERHFHQDYPAAENLIWESGPVPTAHAHTQILTTHSHTNTHCLRRLQKLKELSLTSGCPGKPLFYTACYTVVPPERPCCWILIYNAVNLCVCICICVVCSICLSSLLNLSGFPPTWLHCLFAVCPQTPAHSAAGSSQKESLDSSVVLCIPRL